MIAPVGSLGAGKEAELVVDSRIAHVGRTGCIALPVGHRRAWDYTAGIGFQGRFVDLSSMG